MVPLKPSTLSSDMNVVSSAGPRDARFVRLVGRGPPEADDPDVEVGAEHDRPVRQRLPRVEQLGLHARPHREHGGDPGTQALAGVDPGVEEVALVVDDDQPRRLREVARCHVDAGLDRRHEALQRGGHHRALVAGRDGLAATQPQARPVARHLQPARRSPAAAASRTRRSRSGPRNSVRRTASAGVGAPAARPTGDGVSSPATVPPVVRRSHPSSDQRTCCSAVSRPRVDRWSGPIGRAHRWATYHSPSGVLTREP